MENDLVRQRRRKLEEWASQGHPRYPYAYADRTPVSRVREAAARLEPQGVDLSRHYRVAGRLSLLRRVGRNTFAPLRDASGVIQIHFQSESMGAEDYDRITGLLDGGDIVGVEGFASRSRTGEPSLLASSLELLSKALLPPPEKWHGIKDPEVRMRKRHVDLFTSEEALQRFAARSALTQALRMELARREFLEVETPVLGRVASGAAARPFLSRYHYLDEDFRLRISLELPLKRLLVGGFERVFEIGKVFRNEDMDTMHSPEFTLLELYWAYVDYEDVRKLVEDLLHHLSIRAQEILPGERTDTLVQSFTPPFRQVDFGEALERESGIPGILDLPVEELRALARKYGARITDTTPAGTCLDKLFGHFVEPKLIEPTFVYDHPASTTPLAKAHRSKPGRVERHELYYRGMELTNAYSELNDPEDQEQRFRAQAEAQGNEDTTYAYDADFVEALRYGMPPAGGLGIGLDRLWMILLGSESIKDVILFPPTRSK
jgi:lysyl-tRNA synthetase class 2